MSDHLNFKNTSTVSLVELASAFNEGFAGYFYPAQMTVDILSRRVRMDHLDLQQRIVNEPEESLFIATLTAHGFAEVERQHEMSCDLTTAANPTVREGVGACARK